jgi:hypothetical protein
LGRGLYLCSGMMSVDPKQDLAAFYIDASPKTN